MKKSVKSTKRKDFSNVNTNPVYDMIAEVTAEPEEKTPKKAAPFAQEIYKVQEIYNLQSEQEFLKRQENLRALEMQKAQETLDAQTTHNAQEKPKTHNTQDSCYEYSTKNPEINTKKQYKSRKTYTDTEIEESLLSLKTSGKKGVKLPRINLAFSPDVYNFIKVMAQVRGQNLTQFVNDVLRESMHAHDDIYKKALEFRNSL